MRATRVTSHCYREGCIPRRIDLTRDDWS